MEGWVEESRRAAEITEIIKVSIMTEKSRSDYAMLLSYYRRLTYYHHVFEPSLMSLQKSLYTAVLKEKDR